jgi:leucine-rich PPR motif-containing protein
MKARQNIFADSRRDKAASILDYIINQAFSQDAAGDVLYVKQNTSAEDISLLASILKLMSVLLLKTVKCLSNSDDSVCLKTTRSSSVRDEYDFLISIIKPFQQRKFCLPIQNSFYDMMTIQQSNYKASKSMLVHFSGLLSLSFYNGYDVLAKGCISVIMALMLMFIFEEGDLVDLGSFRSLSLQSCTSEASLCKSKEVNCSFNSHALLKLSFTYISCLNHWCNIAGGWK